MIKLTDIFNYYGIFLWLMSFWRFIRIPLIASAALLGLAVIYLEHKNRTALAATLYHIIQILIIIAFTAQTVYVVHNWIILQSKSEGVLTIYQKAQQVQKKVTTFKKQEELL